MPKRASKALNKAQGSEDIVNKLSALPHSTSHRNYSTMVPNLALLEVALGT